MSPSETVMSPEGMGSSSLAVTKRQELKKWRRKNRELVKKTFSNLDGRTNGDLTVSPGEMEQVSDGSISSLNTMVNVNGNSPVSNVLYGDSGLGGRFAARADSINSEDRSSRSSTAASAPRMKHEITSLNGRNSGISVLPGDQQRNGRAVTSKKARGLVLQKENSHSSIGSDSRSSNFVFVQGANAAACKGRQSGSFTKYDEEYSDDAHYDDEHLNKEAGTAFMKNDAEFEDVSQEDVATDNSWEVKEENIGKHEGSMDEDALVKSLTGLHSAQEELEREVQKWRDVGKDDPLIFDNSILDMLELKDAKILELESASTSGDAKTELEDLLEKIIQAEVEHIVVTMTTKRTAGVLHEIMLNLRQKNLASHNKQVSKKQAERLDRTEDVKKLQKRVCVPSQDIQASKKQGAKSSETREDVKKLQNRVCRFTSCLMIQLILLFVTLYLQFSPLRVEFVPT